MTPENSRRCAGDVVLLNGSAKASAANRFYQRLVRPGATVYSHVALNYSPSTLIHAVPGGVDVICYSDVFRSDLYDDDWRVMRHVQVEQRIAQDPAFEDVIRKHAAYFFQQQYNYLINIKPKRRSKIDSRSFCSELVSKVYEKLGYKLGDVPQKVMPADVATVIAGPEWKDVSAEYKYVPFDKQFFEQIKEFVPAEFVEASGVSRETFVARLLGEDDSLERKQTDLTRAELTIMRSSTGDILKSTQMVNALQDFLRTMGVSNTQHLQEPKLPLDFWDSHHLKKKD